MTSPKDWDDILDEPDQQDGGVFGNPSLNFKFRIEPYRFRIVAAPVAFRQHWRAFKSLHKEDGKPTWSIVGSAWAEGGYTPSRQYACLVIDRDDGQLKIAQGGVGVFKNIRDYQKETGNKVYGEVAIDWQVRVKKVRGQQGGEKTEHSVTAVGDPVALTAEEKERVANFNCDWRKLPTATINSNLRHGCE